MPFEIKITKAGATNIIACDSFDSTITEMCTVFAAEDGCNVIQAKETLISVVAVLENLPSGQEFIAWEIEDHDNNNELITCVISKKE
jgi:hypothetical protein